MKKSKRSFLISFLLALLLLLAVTGCSSAGEKNMDAQSAYATTTLGRVQGLEQDGVSVYKGIPYAKPPVGGLRFRAPEPAEPWSDTLDCTEFGSSALQPTADDIPTPDEDGLNLNVWTSAQERKQPVYVFIHGGACFQGSGAKACMTVQILPKTAWWASPSITGWALLVFWGLRLQRLRAAQRATLAPWTRSKPLNG